MAPKLQAAKQAQQQAQAQAQQEVPAPSRTPCHALSRTAAPP